MWIYQYVCICHISYSWKSQSSHIQFPNCVNVYNNVILLWIISICVYQVRSCCKFLNFDCIGRILHYIWDGNMINRINVGITLLDYLILEWGFTTFLVLSNGWKFYNIISKSGIEWMGYQSCMTNFISVSEWVCDSNQIWFIGIGQVYFSEQSLCMNEELMIWVVNVECVSSWIDNQKLLTCKNEWRMLSFEGVQPSSLLYSINVFNYWFLMNHCNVNVISAFVVYLIIDIKGKCWICCSISDINLTLIFEFRLWIYVINVDASVGIQYIDITVWHYFEINQSKLKFLLILCFYG